MLDTTKKTLSPSQLREGGRFTSARQQLMEVGLQALNQEGGPTLHGPEMPAEIGSTDSSGFVLFL